MKEPHLVNSQIRTAVWLLVLVLAAGAGPAPAQTATDNTVEALKELQELRQEVERRKAELRRELRLLKDVLGDEPDEEVMQLAGGSLGGMTADELAAELRILREEIDRLRQSMARERLTAETARYDVTGRTRTRLEWVDTDFTSGDGDVRQLLRTQVRVTGRPRHDTRVVVELQDARLWGTEFNSFDASADQLDLHQAYLELQEIYGQPLRLRLGRQELAYGSRRLLGPDDWSNTPRAFDALVLRLGEANTVDLLTAKLEETGQRGVRDRNLFALWGDAGLAPGHRVGPYLLLEHDKRAGSRRLLRLTLGTRLTGAMTGRTGHLFGYDVEGALQVGEVGSQDARAWMGTATVRYRGPSWTEPEVRLGVDLYSGDDDPAAGKARAFDNLFAARHEVLGLMDLFRELPFDLDGGGILDARMIGEMSASETVRVGLHLHHFALLKAATGDKVLGQEADAVLTYEYSEVTQLHWGGSIFVPGDAMKRRSGGEDPAFKTWMQLAVRF